MERRGKEAFALSFFCSPLNVASISQVLGRLLGVDKVLSNVRELPLAAEILIHLEAR